MGRKRKVPRTFRPEEWYEYQTDSSDATEQALQLPVPLLPSTATEYESDSSDAQLPVPLLFEDSIPSTATEYESCLLYTSPSPRD